MKHKLRLIFSCIFFISLLSCEKEEFETVQLETENQIDFKFKRVRFSEIKTKIPLIKKLNEVNSILNPLQSRGVFSEDFGVYIDTTNIVVIENQGK